MNIVKTVKYSENFICLFDLLIKYFINTNLELV